MTDGEWESLKTPTDPPGTFTFRLWPVRTRKDTTMPDTTQPAPVKPAYKTTEAWLNFLTGVLGAATTSHLIGDGSTIATVAGLVITMAATALHTWSRTTLKAAA